MAATNMFMRDSATNFNLISWVKDIPNGIFWTDIFKIETAYFYFRNLFVNLPHLNKIDR